MDKRYDSIIMADLHRIFSSWRVYVSIVIALFFLLRPLFETSVSWANMSPLQLLSLPFGASDFAPFAVMFCVFPFADSFCMDYNSGIINNITTRVKVNRFAKQRVITVALSGAFVMFICVLIPIAFCNIFAGRDETYETAYFMRNTIWWKAGALLPLNGLVFYWGRLVLAALFGALWSLIALAISTIVTNRYVTLIIPFVLCQALWYLLGESPFNPVHLIRADNSNIPFLSFAILYQITLIFFFSVLSIIGMKKKVSI